MSVKVVREDEATGCGAREDEATGCIRDDDATSSPSKQLHRGGALSSTM
jgi:hypothetical protein